MRNIFLLSFLLLFVTPSFAQVPSIPAAPTTAAATLGKGIVLTWLDKSSNELCFPVETKINAATDWTFLACVPRNTQTFTHKVYLPGKYCYRVRAINEVGDSGYTNEPCLDYVPAKPAPVAITVGPGFESNVVTWVPSPTAIGVHIYRKTTANGAWGFLDTAPNDLGLFHDHKIALDTVYCYRLTAYGYGGDSDNSNEVCK